MCKIENLDKCQKEAMKALRFQSPDIPRRRKEEWVARIELVEEIDRVRDEWNPQKDQNHERMKWCREASKVLNAVVNFRAIPPKGLTWSKNAPKPKNYQDILDRLMNVARAARRVDLSDLEKKRAA